MFLLNKLEKLILRIKVKKEGGQLYSYSLRRYFLKHYKIAIGYGTYGGCFNKNNIPSNVTFGNYCSIAPNIKIFRANHPKDYFTTHPLFYNPTLGYVTIDTLKRPPLKIDHDVWIGEGVIILSGVLHVGNGAIIGAGSVVTKDVPAYSIVAGNPAKIIGKRFSDEKIFKLEKTQWWNWDKDTLIKNKSLLEAIVNE